MRCLLMSVLCPSREHISKLSKRDPYMVTTCLVNLEMSGNLTAVREMSGILLKIREMSGEKSCQGKLPKTSVFFVTVRAGTAYRHLFLPKICFFSFFNVYGPHYSCTPSCALNHKQLFRPELHC